MENMSQQYVPPWQVPETRRPVSMPASSYSEYYRTASGQDGANNHRQPSTQHSQRGGPRSPRGRRRSVSDTRRSVERVRTHGRQHRPFAAEERERRQKAFKNHVWAGLGEFIGTTLFLWFAFAGTKVAIQTSPDDVDSTQRVMYISLVFGLSYLVTVWAFHRISGGLFNPAVTLALGITRMVPWMRCVYLILAQFLGGIVAAGLVKCMFPGGSAMFATRLGAGTSIAQGVFIEMFLTALLVFVNLMLASERHHKTFVAPIGIGLALFVAELAGVYWTGGSLNPARSFGPDVVTPSFPGYHYIYWLGPLMGGLLAGGYYKLVKAFHHEEATVTNEGK